MIAQLLKHIAGRRRKAVPVRIELFGPHDILRLMNWTYPHPYSCYDISTDEREMLEFLNGDYYAVYRGRDNLIGFFCLRSSARLPEAESLGVYSGDALDFGLGMRPDLIGKGTGFEFVQAGIQFFKKTVRPRVLRLTVATFNIRAIKVYERCGFTVDRVFSVGDVSFLIMILACVYE